MATYITGTNQELHNVHSADDCVGTYCVIHNPSKHPMVTWRTHWRSDRQLMERLCPTHNVGHPDPDHIAHLPVDRQAIESEHGCCDCERESRDERESNP
jgi:hypothetical protein